MFVMFQEVSSVFEGAAFALAAFGLDFREGLSEGGLADAPKQIGFEDRDAVEGPGDC